MACSIRIDQVSGSLAGEGDHIGTVSIDGTAVECAAVCITMAVFGENERERLVGVPETVIEDMDENGRFHVEIDITAPENVVPNARPVHCGDRYQVWASCRGSKTCNGTKAGVFCGCPAVRVSTTEEECTGELRTVAFDVEITPGDEVAVVAFSSGIRENDLVMNFVAQPGQILQAHAMADYPRPRPRSTRS